LSLLLYSVRPPTRPTLFPYTTLFRSLAVQAQAVAEEISSGHKIQAIIPRKLAAVEAAQAREPRFPPASRIPATPPRRPRRACVEIGRASCREGGEVREAYGARKKSRR